MYLNPKSKYCLGLSQKSIYNTLADILYTQVSSKSNCFICLPSLVRSPLKTEFIPWASMNFLRQCDAIRTLWGLQTRFLLYVPQTHYCLISFLKQCISYSPCFFIIFLWTTFLSFLFNFVTDADYKQQQWFRSYQKQNPKVVKHMLHMVYKHFHFLIVSVKIWNVWIMLEVDSIQQA